MRKIVLFLAVIVAFLGQSPHGFAGQVTVMDVPKDCPRQVDIQGNRSLVYVNSDQDCDKDQVRPYGMVDERLGLQFHAPEFKSYIYLSKVIEPAKVDPAENGNLCVRLFPDGAVLELIVPIDEPCVVEWSHYSRRYWNGQACTFPGNYCVGIDTLTPEGRRRAEMSIALSQRSKQIAGAK